jgi:hypothetical protein
MKNLKIKLTFISFSLFFFCSFGQKKTGKEADFTKICSEITNAFAKKNIADINKYINLEIGVYIITRPGAMDAIIHESKLNETKPFSVPYPYKDPGQVKKHKITYGATPKYDCGTQKWDKRGFIADTLTKYNRASDVAYMNGKYGREKPSEEEIEKLKAFENNSRKIVFTEINKIKGLVFHLTLINGKWYLFLIDTVASSCEA